MVLSRRLTALVWTALVCMSTAITAVAWMNIKTIMA